MQPEEQLDSYNDDYAYLLRRFKREQPELALRLQSGSLFLIEQEAFNLWANTRPHRWPTGEEVALALQREYGLPDLATARQLVLDEYVAAERQFKLIRCDDPFLADDWSPSDFLRNFRLVVRQELHDLCKARRSGRMAVQLAMELLDALGPERLQELLQPLADDAQATLDRWRDGSG